MIDHFRPPASRDKRTQLGQARYPRRFEDHVLLLAECLCGPHASSTPGGVCGLCGEAVLTREERGAFFAG